MAELLKHLIPVTRSIRVPLGCGLAWFAVAWFCYLATDSEQTPVGLLLERAVTPLPTVVVAGALAFVATTLGAGAARASDRFMQNRRHRVSARFSPLDISTTPDGRGQVQTKTCYTTVLTDQISSMKDLAVELPKWHQTSPDSVHDEELSRFRRNLLADSELSGQAAEQSLRFAILPPVITGLAMLALWELRSHENSKLVALAALAMVAIFLIFDYYRIGISMRGRWLELLVHYPAWLSDDEQASRAAYFEPKAARLSLTSNVVRDDSVYVRNSGPSTAHDVKVIGASTADTAITVTEREIPSTLLAQADFRVALGSGFEEQRIELRVRWTDGANCVRWATLNATEPTGS